MNAEQQRLIEDLLDERRRSDPSLEPHFNGQMGEPVFVKNLETVQGDQRDVILISVGYGPITPDSPTMSMNFGPLNRTGGERRLNVAITRATTEVIIFASFDASMIDLSRTQASAVRDLKNYIDFAERGPVALGEAVSLAAADRYDSDFEFVVAEGLRRRGWTVRTQVGVSKFRVDLGIVHPDAAGRFLVGIECDGAAYHSSPTARDRDRVRQAILENLGWRLLRIWSTHYFLEPDAVLDDVHDALVELLAKDRAEAAAELSETAPLLEQTTEDMPEPAEPIVAEQKVAGLPASPQATSSEDLFEADDPDAFPPLPPAEGTRFYDGDYTRTLAAIAVGTIDREGPMTFHVLAGRMARMHGFKRTGSEIKKRVWATVQKARPLSAAPDGHRVCWPKDMAPAPVIPFRGVEVGGINRGWSDLPYPEKAGLVAEAIAADPDDFQGEVGSRMGQSRIGAAMRVELDAIREAAIALEV